MNSSVQNILQHLFQTDSLQNVSAEQIQQLIDEKPYYDAAYFLLAKKLQAAEHNNYLQAAESAALHFSNELWLYYGLNEERFAIDDVEQPTLASHEQSTAFREEKSENIIEEPAVVAITNQPQTVSNITQGENEYDEEIDDADENYTEADFPVNEKLSNLLKQQAAELNKPVENAVAAEIPVENTPYHRVDYFDSQGIKLEENKNNDKLGTQLRRFTDWLKQMKNVNTNPTNLGDDVKGEQEVENFAQHSNEQEEVVTETMAEVLIKQGKPKQAIEIYEKLSFINPSKSAYFAAKIEELKK